MSSSESPQTSPLQAVRNKLIQLIEALPEGIILFDPAWRITYANAAARSISRIQPEHLNGPSHWELYPATVGTEQERIYRRSMEERLVLEHEFYYPPYDVWISLRTVPIDGGIAVYYQDISRLKRAEALRDENARRLQQVFDTTTDGVLYFDRNYNFTFVNARARQILAISGELVGQNLWEKYPDARYEGSPYVFHYDNAMTRGVAGHFEAFYPAPLNLWLSVEVQPADDGIIVFFRDITEQKAAAAELHRQREETERRAAEIEAIFRTAPIGLAFFDPVDFRYLKLNDRQAAFFGLPPDQIVGRTLTEMAPIPGLRELFEQVASGIPVINFPLEGALLTDPEEHRYWTVNYVPVVGSDGSIQGISAASLEVTQQKRAEQALVQSEKLAAVGRLASSISHEINNPLESVTNLLYLLSTRDDLTPGAIELVRIAQEELERVTQITTQTLRFHRQTEKPFLTTPKDLLDPVLRLYRGRLNHSGIAIEPDYAGAPPVLCLASEIRQVLNNLIGNAMDAMPNGGRLLVRARSASEPSTRRSGLRITVADTGHGMSPATRQRIFDAFFTTKDAHGTGLGLWISAEIVARHRGSLRVHSSTAPHHHGTVFTLFLPFATDDPATAP